MDVWEMCGLIGVIITFIVLCFLCCKKDCFKIIGCRIVFILLIAVNIVGIGCFIYRDMPYVIPFGGAIFLLESGFLMLFRGYFSSKKVFFLALLLGAIFFFHLSLELVNLESSNPLTIISNTISHSFQTFTLDLNYTEVFIENGFKDGGCCKMAAGMLGIFLTILAPTTGGFILLSLVVNIFPFIKLFLVCFWKKKFYIFSELNEHSIITAESIRDKEKYKPVIIFTDVYTDSSMENSSELLERAKKIDAICFSIDIIILKFPWFIRHCRFDNKIELNYMLMDLEEKNNLETTLNLIKIDYKPKSKTLIEQNYINKFNKKKKVDLYIFSSQITDSALQVETHLRELEQSNDKDFLPNCRIINEYKNLSYQFIYGEIDRSEFSFPLYYNLEKSNRTDKLSILIVGADRFCKEFLKTTYWCGQMLNKEEPIPLDLTIISPNAFKIKDEMTFENPAIFLKKHVETDTDNTYAFLNSKAKFTFINQEFKNYAVLNQNNTYDYDYVLISLENNLNIEIADWLERRIKKCYSGKSVFTPIVFHLKNKNIYQKKEKHLPDSDAKQKAKLYEDGPVLTPIDFLQICYNIESIKFLETQAEKADKLKQYSFRDILKDIRVTERLMNDYRLNSSKALVLNWPYKLFSIRRNVSKAALASLEHRRWIAYMETIGYEPITIDVLNKFKEYCEKVNEKGNKEEYDELEASVKVKTAMMEGKYCSEGENYDPKLKEIDTFCKRVDKNKGYLLEDALNKASKGLSFENSSPYCKLCIYQKKDFFRLDAKTNSNIIKIGIEESLEKFKNSLNTLKHEEATTEFQFQTIEFLKILELRKNDVCKELEVWQGITEEEGFFQLNLKKLNKCYFSLIWTNNEKTSFKNVYDDEHKKQSTFSHIISNIYVIKRNIYVIERKGGYAVIESKMNGNETILELKE